MRASIRLRMSLICVLTGLLLAGAAPAAASQEQAVEQASKAGDDEREDSKVAATTAKAEAPTVGPDAEATGDPAFNTLEDIVRLRAGTAILLAQCRPSSDSEPQPLTIAWRDVEN